MLERTATVDTMDFEEFRDRYLRYCRTTKTLSGNTISAYTQDLNEFARFRALSDEHAHVSPDTILEFLAYLQDRRDLKPASVKRRIACVRGFFKWLEREGQIQQSPFHGLGLHVRLPRKLPRALTRTQVYAVTKAALRAPKYHRARRPKSKLLDVTSAQFTTQLAIRLLLATGVRVGELTSIKLPDVTADGTAIRISGKGNRERTVFIGNPRLQSDLEAYLLSRVQSPTDSNHLLLNQRGKPLTPQGLRLRLRRISDELQIYPRVTPHRFRHTAATLLIEEGVDMRLVQKLLGHSSISTTEIYTHVSDTSLKSAIERADPMAKLGL